MQFRNQSELAEPARFRSVSGLLPAFIVFSLLVHVGSLLFSTGTVMPLPETRFGSTMISAVLTPIKTTPAATSSANKLTSASVKQPVTKSAETTSINSRRNGAAIIMAKTSSTKISDSLQNKLLVIKQEKNSSKTEDSYFKNTPAKTVQSAHNEPTNEQRQNQQEQQRNYLLGEIQNQLARYLSYPLRARKRGWQGEVMLAFHINESGQLNDVRLTRSSGYSLLDRSALNAISKLKYLALPDNMGRPQAMDLQLPVQFKLHES